MNLRFENNSEKFSEAGVLQLSDFWVKQSKIIEETLFKITGLNFLEDITVHLNDEESRSYPVLMLKAEKMEDMQDNLIHELIHVLLTQNKIGATEKWKFIMEKYKNETQLTKVHIVVHKIHYELAKIIFPERVEPIKNYSVIPEYVKSWQIVLKDEIDVRFIL